MRVLSPTSFPSPTGQLAIALLVMLSCVSACHLVGLSSGACCAPVLRTSFEPPGSTCPSGLLFSDSYRPRQSSQRRCRISAKQTRVMPFIGTRCPSSSRRCAAGRPTCCREQLLIALIFIHSCPVPPVVEIVLFVSPYLAVSAVAITYTSSPLTCQGPAVDRGPRKWHQDQRRE